MHEANVTLVAGCPTGQITFSRSFTDLLAVATDYDLAVSGDALTYAESIGLAPQLIPLCQVGALTAAASLSPCTMACVRMARVCGACPARALTEYWLYGKIQDRN